MDDGTLREPLSKPFLQSIVERSGGDIRSAINSFQFSLSKSTNEIIVKLCSLFIIVDRSVLIFKEKTERKIKK